MNKETLIDIEKRHRPDDIDVGWTDKNGRTYAGTGDKGTGHNYIESYENLFKDIRYDAKNIFEIGVCGGYSLRMWKEYFPNAMIYGADVNVECLDHNEDRIKVFHMDATNQRIIMDNFSKINYGDIRFDVIIDDGSHQMTDQRSSFMSLYPYLSDNGIYVIEDVSLTAGRNYPNEPDVNVEYYKSFHRDTEIIDLRSINNRWDDILVVIRKGVK